MRKYILILSMTIYGMAWASDDEKAQHGGEESATEEQAVEAMPSQEVKNYVVGILRAGSNSELDSLAKAEMLESHVDYLRKLNEQGQLFASGPLSSDPEVRGLYIFNVPSIAAAETLMQLDAAVQSRLVTIKYHVWRTRDYSPPIQAKAETAEGESLASSIDIYTLLVIIFALILIILMLRTFRMKASV